MMIRIEDDDDQLDCEALETNQQLLNFDVKSKNIDWSIYVVPLEERAPPIDLQQYFPIISNHYEPIREHNKREILVCHDMLGNYREDRFFRSSKKYDDYRFYHWAGIDYFCYFSHHYITIPPSGWINAAHRHGVRVLGTFIVEGFRGSRAFHEILMSLELIDRVVQALVKLCNHFKFEGWLVNIECKIEATAIENLFYFLETLRSEVESKIKSGCVFWYDSVIESGDLMWQNEINMRNVRFMKSVSAMLINYGWNDRSLDSTLRTCTREHVEQHRAFAGIDIFGRGQIAKFHTRRTLARIARKTMSAGLFGPGWTFETLQQFGYDINKNDGDDALNAAFLERNDKFWWSLWDHLPIHPYIKLPFYTDTCLGSGKCRYRFGRLETGQRVSSGSSFFNLSQQSLQPSIPLYQLAERYYDNAFNGGSCLRILRYDSSFRLFVTDFLFRYGNGLVCAYAFKLSQRDGEFDCVLRISSPDDKSRDCYLFLGDYTNTITLLKGRCYISPIRNEYTAFLKGPLETKYIPKDLNPALANGWRIRYYLLAFDGSVSVKDIGLLYRRTRNATETAYFGAFYINECDATTTFVNFPNDISNFSYIHVYRENLLN